MKTATQLFLSALMALLLSTVAYADSNTKSTGQKTDTATAKKNARDSARTFAISRCQEKNRPLTCKADNITKDCEKTLKDKYTLKTKTLDDKCHLVKMRVAYTCTIKVSCWHEKN